MVRFYIKKICHPTYLKKIENFLNKILKYGGENQFPLFGVQYFTGLIADIILK